jgi:hypothetical protein
MKIFTEITITKFTKQLAAQTNLPEITAQSVIGEIESVVAT